MKQAFPVLCNNSDLVFLDTAASAQKPQVVIDAMQHFYNQDYATVHRGIYDLSVKATQQYENARDRVQHFIHAALREEIIFTCGATAAINLVAHSFGALRICAGDEILISAMEHHANIVPWQMLCARTGAILQIIPLELDGSLNVDAYAQQLNAKTKLVAITHISNVLGHVNPIAEMIAMARAQNHEIAVLIDGAQAAGRLSIDVQALDCDFYVFSAHKMYGPTGVGILYGKKRWLDAMPPYQGGGDMIRQVRFSGTEYADLPYKFEAGTPNIAGVIGLAAAISFVESVGLDHILQHEIDLTDYAVSALRTIPGLVIYGTVMPKIGIIAFTMAAAHAHDLGTILGAAGVAIRAGHHCAMPLMEHYHVPAMARVSFGVYNTCADVDALIVALDQVLHIFGDNRC